MEQQLAEQYEQAGIEFRGITAEQVETAAVRYYAPCSAPPKAQRSASFSTRLNPRFALEHSQMEAEGVEAAAHLIGRQQMAATVAASDPAEPFWRQRLG